MARDLVFWLAGFTNLVLISISLGSGRMIYMRGPRVVRDDNPRLFWLHIEFNVILTVICFGVAIFGPL